MSRWRLSDRVFRRQCRLPSEEVHSCRFAASVSVIALTVCWWSAGRGCVGSARDTAVVWDSLSQAPLGLDTVDVQFAGAGRAGCDDGVVEHGFDDGLLAVDVEVVPLAA